MTDDVRGATAVVAGALANKVGNGGEAWVRPTWTIGLARLGFDTWFVEELAPSEDPHATMRAVDWFCSVTAAFGLSGRCALISGDRTLVGPPLDQVAAVLADATLFVNISGHLRRKDLPTPSAVRVFLDVDPGFTQIWADQGRIDLGGHDRHVTVGTAIGTVASPLPDNGLDWITVLPPVLLDHWGTEPMPSEPPRFTTVGSWRPPHGTVEHDGTAYGIKAHEFRRHLDLPAQCQGVDLELALSIHDGDAADRERLVAAGYSVVDPASVAATPAEFADHVRGSWGEWSVAQGVYVEGRTGWFSDRSAHFLASGRPVVVQDTGSALPVGQGHLVFSDVVGAAAAIREVVAEPAAHGAAARELAEQHLGTDRVIGSLCDRIGVSS